MRILLIPLATIIIIFAVVAWGEQLPTPTTLEEAIQLLQPRTDDARAKRLAKIFHEAGEEHGFDPKLLVAISFRESSLSPEMEELRRFGKVRGEIGLMQCHGAALRFRPEKCQAELRGAWCQIHTGTRYLAHLREKCQGSTWRWLAAYGSGKCMSEREATHSTSIKNAIRYYRRIGGVDQD